MLMGRVGEEPIYSPVPVMERDEMISIAGVVLRQLGDTPEAREVLAMLVHPPTSVTFHKGMMTSRHYG